jgi:DNA-binding MarR family transcriptional regulator
MESQLAQFRAFNRFYTALLGLLDSHYLDSAFSLTEVRTLYEIDHAKNGITATELTAHLQIDKGYLSRILRQFEKKQLIVRQRSPQDGRSALLRLTDKGSAVFKPLDGAARQQASKLLGTLSASDVNKLLRSMTAIQTILKKVKMTSYAGYTIE